MHLVPAAVELLRAAIDGPLALEQALGVQIPEGWPEFPEALPATIEFLTLFPEQSAWSMYFFVDEEAEWLIGSGGFKGAPHDGIVEIGYEVAPAWRGQGLATEAAALLIAQARTSSDVYTIAAETNAVDNPSAKLLRTLGFSPITTRPDPEVGTIWHWTLPA